MNDSNPLALESLLYALFEEMRQEGMALTFTQLDLAHQAIKTGYGLGGWDDLKRTCQYLWVKPSPNYDLKLFEKAFAQVQQTYQVDVLEAPPLQKPLETPLNIPQVPPRKKVLPEQSGEVQIPVAVKDNAPSSKKITKTFRRTFIPVDFPVNTRDVQMTWRLLRQWIRLGYEYELDFEATLERIQKEGLYGDVVLRPVLTRRAQFILLVDDSNAMIPFLPAVQPFVQAVEEHRIAPSQIYTRPVLK